MPPVAPLDTHITAVSVRSNITATSNIATTHAASSQASSSQIASTIQNVIIIEPGIHDWQQLVAGTIPEAIVYVLDGRMDGVLQITEILTLVRGDRPNQPLQLHLLCHGASGILLLGKATLTARNCDRYHNELRRWFPAPKTGGASQDSLVIYACEAAAGEQGQLFMQSLAKMTGVGIASSTTPTGSAALEGDWEFGFQTGGVAIAEVFLPEVKRSYSHVMAQTDKFAGQDELAKRTPSRLSKSSGSR